MVDKLRVVHPTKSIPRVGWKTREAIFHRGRPGYLLNARINRGDEVVGLAFGQAVTLHADGSVSQRPVDDSERRRIQIEEVGLSEEIVSQLPADIPTPPPPGSRSAGQ